MEQVFIKQVFHKSGVSGQNKPYEFWSVVLGDGRTCSCNENVSSFMGQSVNADITSKQNGKYVNYFIKIPQAAAHPVTQQPAAAYVQPQAVATAPTSSDIGPKEAKLKVLYAAIEASSFIHNKMETDTEKTAAILTLYDTFLAKVNEV